MKKAKRILSVFLVAAMAATLTACGGGSSSGGSTTATTAGSSDETTSDTAAVTGDIPMGDELKVALNADPPTLDALMSTGAIVRDCNKYIFEGLFEMDENYQPQLQLAESYEANEDYTEYTFKLRSGVKFHNGKEMTSEDVVASLNRWLSLNNAVKSIITNGEQFEAVDDLTVKITLQAPCYLLPSVMAAPAQFPCIMPKEAVEGATTEGGIQEYIGTGPLKYVDWVQNQYLELEHYDEYQGPGYELTGEAGDKTINFEKVTLYFGTDATIRSAGIQSGEYDIVSNLNYDDVAMLSANPSVKLDKSLMGYTGIIMNKAEGTLGTNEKLREAITLALDCDEIMAAAYPADGYIDVTPSMMPEGSTWYTLAGTENINTKNMDAAKAALAEANYDGTPIKVVTNQTYPQHYNGTLVMVEQLKELGVEVDLQVVDWTTMLEYKRTQGTYDLYYMDYPAVTAPVSLRTISQTDEGWTTWPEFLELLTKVNAATSDEEAAAAWEECQAYLFGRFSFVPLGYSYYANATLDNIEGYHSISCQCIYGCYRAE